MRKLLAVLFASSTALVFAAGPASAATRTATFVPRSALYVQGGTSGPFNTKVGGTVAIVDSGANALTAKVRVFGLAPNTRYVTVAYKDGGCLPLPGLSAFPSGAFTSSAKGGAYLNVPVSPTSLNPLGTLYASQVRSISIRQVVINGIAIPFTIPNNPYPLTPTIPNVAYVEACDISVTS